MFARLLAAIARAFADALYALGMGFKGAFRPSVLLRSAAIAIVAAVVTWWLFLRHWDVAQVFVAVFMPVMFLGFGLTGAQSGGGPGVPATTTGGFDLVGGLSQLGHGMNTLAHAAGALALAALCGFLLCGMLLTVLGVRAWLLPEVVRRTRASQPELSPVSGAASRWRALGTAACWVIGVLILTQLIHLAAVFVPHLGFLWLVPLAYLPVAFIAAQSLRGVASPDERSRVLRRQRGAFAILGLVVLASGCVPVLNLLTPAIFVIGTTRLSYRTLAGLRGSAAAS